MAATDDQIVELLNNVNNNLIELKNAITHLEKTIVEDDTHILNDGLRALLQGQTPANQNKPLFELIREDDTNILDRGIRPQTVALMQGFQAVVQALQAHQSGDSSAFPVIITTLTGIISAFG